MPTWKAVLLIGGMFAFVGLVFGPLFLRLTLDRRIRKQLLPRDKIYDGPMDSYGGLIRSMLFGSASLFDRYNHHTAIAYDYEGVDVKSFANWFEKLLAIWWLGGLVVMCTTGIVLQIMEWME